MSEKYNDENVKKILRSQDIPERLEPESIKEMLDGSNAVRNRKRIKQKKALRIVSAAAAFAVAVTAAVRFAEPAVFKSSKTSDEDSYSAVEELTTMKAAADYSDIYKYFFAAKVVNKFRDRFELITGGAKSDMMFYEEDGEVYDEAVYDDVVYGEAEYADDSSSMADIQQNNAAASGNMEGNGVYESEAEKKEYSDTYSQETDVLEADIVKTDGNYIFYAKDDTLYISGVDKGRFTSPYKTDVSTLLGVSDDKYDETINDMYIYNGKLILICNVGEPSEYRVFDDCAGYSNECPNTYVMIVNIAERITLDGYYVQEGAYSDVRLMSDGFLYVISNDEKYLDLDETKKDDIEAYVPKYCVCDVSEFVKPDDIMIPPGALKEMYNYVSYTNVSGLDLNSQEPWSPVDMKSIAGYSDNIYCSQQNLYVASGYEETDITRFSIQGGVIEIAASGTVGGYIKDQFSMSEKDGYLRIAVTKNVYVKNISRENIVYVLDMSLNTVGSIGGIGLNEEIKSVSFNGDIAYVVTFRTTDPLYAIDLSDPANPEMLDELKVSGYSAYMQNWGDGLLVGFGAEADEDTGWQTGIKLSMFDNSDPENLQLLDSVSITDDEAAYVYSEGIYERKSIYIDPERNIIGFPVVKDKYASYDGTVKPIIYSYLFYSYVNGKFVSRGGVTAETSYDYEKEVFRRAVFIDGYLYIVSAGDFRALDAVTFTHTDQAIF
ncbi:MAG: beta-propeller domain-containing protein [Clostridium sp.]|nr:beta-propeller domain-containing protein [Clostridium sp.]MCM1547970.1 beta-propeller domain-containing protein [Ruminococcus sp.]